MRYLVIRNIRLASLPPDQPHTSVLVCGDRIVGIGNNLQHPLIDTESIDGEGRYVIPSLIDVCKVQPDKFNADVCKTLNFENVTAGVTTIMTVASDVEENIADMQGAQFKMLNYAFHFPLRQVTEANKKRFRRLMIMEGIATAIVRFGDERHADVETMRGNIETAKELGLMVLYDFRSVPDSVERLAKLECLAEVLAKVGGCKAYILGIETTDELGVVKKIRERCDAKAHICLNPFLPPDPMLNRMTPEVIANTLRHEEWATLGLAYSASRVLKECWPDTAPEIVSRNKLSIINSISLREPLSVSELSEFVVERPAKFTGLRVPLASVSEGMSANLIIWNPDTLEDVTIAPPGVNAVHLRLSGRIDYVIMNGQVVMGDKFIPKRVCGGKQYARIV